MLVLCTTVLSIAQESPSPEASPPTAKAGSVRISFLPPPLDGSISLGIYDTKGKLVRILHREADLDAFEIGSDALSTAWDGKNDAGENMPLGKYHARGYVVGDLKVEGVGYFFNDWVTDEDSPHIKKIEDIAREGEQSLLLLATLAGGDRAIISTNLEGQIAENWDEPDAKELDLSAFVSSEKRNLRVEAGKLSLDASTPAVSWPELIAPEDACYGRGDTVWVIDHAVPGDTHKEVKQFSRDGEFLRRLSVNADEPVPTIIRASATDDKIFLLEESQAMQRLRELSLLQARSEEGRSVSDWKVGLEKKIVAHKDFAIEGGKPLPGGGSAPLDKIAVKLRPNPLENDARVALELSTGSDANGSFLRTVDGLPLQSISDTPHLTRVVVAPHGEKSLDVFQDDDAVVEQFRISGLDQMMAFDCGEFELK